MYVITEKYLDFNGVERTEDFLFNLTTTELAKMEFSELGGLTNMLQTLISKKDIPKMLKVFETIVDSSYGVKSPDGRKFIKNSEVLDDFKSTNAYSQIFMRFSTDEKFTSDFIKNVIPGDLNDQVEKMAEKAKLSNVTQMPTT